MAMAQDQGISLDSLNKYLDSGDETFLYQMGLKEIEAPKQEALSLKGSLADEEKWEWNDNLFGRFETEQYDKNASLGENALTFGKNLLKSWVNVLSDVWNMIVNPLDTANALWKTAVGGVANLLWVDEDMAQWGDRFNSANDTADQVWQFFSDRYGGWEQILNTLFTDPVGVISDAATLISWWAGAVKGITTWAAKATAKAWLKGTTRALERTSNTAWKIAKAWLEYDPYSVAMKLEMKPISATIDYAKKVPWASKIMKEKLNEALDKTVWLDKLTKKAIQDNPFSKEVWQKAKTWIDANWLPEKSTEVSKQLITDVSEKVQNAVAKEMEKLWDTWPMYQPLKEAWFSVDLTNLKNWGLDEILTDYGIKIEDWKLDFSKSAIDGSEASNIKKIYDRVQDTNSPMPMNEYIDRFRKTISDMVNFNTNNKNALWKKLADTPWDKVLKSIRERANELAHEQVPALKDLDSAFTKQSELVKEITEWIVYKDKAKMWVVRDNIDQIVKNLDTNNRAQLKARLEKIIPWIEQEVKAINMLPKLIDNYYRPSKLQQKISGTAWAIIWTTVGWIPWWLLWAWAWYWLSNKIDKLKSRKRDKIISETSKDWADKLADIQNRIANNEKISQAQKAFLKEISQRLKEWKQVKEWEVMRIISDIMSAEEWKELAVLDKAISELETLWAKDEVKEWKKFREDMIWKMDEEAEMNRYAEEFEAEKQNIINESADQKLPEFKRRIYQLWQEERRIWSVAWKKIWKNFEGKDYHRQQQTEWLRKKEAVIKEIQDYYNVDQFEASEIYDRIERQASADDLKYQRYWTANPNEKGISATEWLNIRNFKNWKTVQELANQYWIDTKIVDSISTPEWQRAYWMYWDRLITISKDLKESTVPHELLHGVFDMVDSKRRTSILEWIQKKLNVDNVQAEEWLADNFSEYYRTGKFWTKWLAKWLVEKVKQFFYEVKSYIDWTYKNEKQIRQLFDDIIDWKIEWEYWVYSDPKFQSVWHGSPYSFEKFDSSNMGKWEWAQAHGWGHYVAKDKSTWEHYAQMGEFKNKWEYDWEWMSWSNDTPRQTAINLFLSQMQYNVKNGLEKNPQKVLEYLIDERKYVLEREIKAKENLIKTNKEYGVEVNDTTRIDKNIQKYESDIRELQKLDPKKLKQWDTDKHLYEVEIPDPIKKDTPTWSNYLEEGRLTKKQANDIIRIAEEEVYWNMKTFDKADINDARKIAEQVFSHFSNPQKEYSINEFVKNVEKYSKEYNKNIADAIDNELSYHAYLSSTLRDWKIKSGLYDFKEESTASTWREVYNELERIFWSDKSASKFLESLWYDWIHYFWWRDWEAYVIFNDDALQITKHHKY